MVRQSADVRDGRPEEIVGVDDPVGVALLREEPLHGRPSVRVSVVAQDGGIAVMGPDLLAEHPVEMATPPPGLQEALPQTGLSALHEDSGADDRPNELIRALATLMRDGRLTRAGTRSTRTPRLPAPLLWSLLDIPAAPRTTSNESWLTRCFTAPLCASVTLSYDDCGAMRAVQDALPYPSAPPGSPSWLSPGTCRDGWATFQRALDFAVWLDIFSPTATTS
jgi:hypothetical protein